MNAFRARDAEQIAHLARADQHGGARGEPHDHGMGNKVDQCPEPGEAQRELEQAGQEREREDHLDIRGAAGRRMRTDRREQHDRDRGRGAGNEVM
jgi:hypothetical protein